MPTRPVEVEVRSWEQFTRFAAETDIGSPIHPTFIFRGQGDASWPLIPALTRIALKEGLDTLQTINIEIAARKKFRELAHLYLPARSIPGEDDIISWWILMQHYGVPTRGLDWSESPFVGLYFAVEGRLEQPGAVWVLHAASLIEYSSQADKAYKPLTITPKVEAFLDPKAKPFLFILTRKTHTDRMSAQQTQTSISTQPLADHGTIIGDILPDRPKVEQFSKLIIPAALKFEFMRRLRSLNVTARTLFPGIEGLGRSVSELIRLGSLYHAR